MPTVCYCKALGRSKCPMHKVPVGYKQPEILSKLAPKIITGDIASGTVIPPENIILKVEKEVEPLTIIGSGFATLNLNKNETLDHLAEENLRPVFQEEEENNG